MTDTLPGHATAVDGEVRRLFALRDHLASTGDAIQHLDVAGWDGAARDAFDEFRLASANRWYTVADRHEDAARQLERYHNALVELQARAAYTDQAADDLARWRGQLDSAARTAADAIRRAAKELDALPEPPHEPTPPNAPLPMPVSTHSADLDPRQAHLDPTAYRQRVEALCAELATARIIPMARPA